MDLALHHWAQLAGIHERVRGSRSCRWNESITQLGRSPKIAAPQTHHSRSANGESGERGAGSHVGCRHPVPSSLNAPARTAHRSPAMGHKASSRSTRARAEPQRWRKTQPLLLLLLRLWQPQPTAPRSIFEPSRCPPARPALCLTRDRCATAAHHGSNPRRATPGATGSQSPRQHLTRCPAGARSELPRPRTIRSASVWSVAS